MFNISFESLFPVYL